MKLVDLASTIRSKNAGVDHITFDVICRDRPNFERVRDSGALNRTAVARLFGIDEGRVTDFVVFEPANAIKFTIRRLRPSGGMGGERSLRRAAICAAVRRRDPVTVAIGSACWREFA